MSKASQIVFKAFLGSCSSEKQAALMQFLPPNEIEELASIAEPHTSVLHGIAKIERELSKVHVSWPAPFFRTLSSSDLPLFLSTLDSTQKKELSSLLGMDASTPATTRPAQSYMRTVIAQKLQSPQLPYECLPKSPFNTLLSLSLSQLNKLIALLSMYDLANEQGQIIQKNKQAAIIESLTTEQKTLLARLSGVKDRLQFKSMNLNKWDGNIETLKTLLNQRGINRLSKATVGQDESFLWHLTHSLDVNSAQLFKKLHAPIDNREAQKILQNQVLSLADLFQPKRENKEGAP